MTKLTDHEDFLLTPPAAVTMDMERSLADAIWKPLAKKLGWFWSDAHGGYINHGRRGYMGRPGDQWDSYHVADIAYDACFFDGFETVEAALKALEED